MRTTISTNCPTQTARGTRVGVASRSKRLFALTNANWSAIIGESVEVIECATIIGMLIVCWAIYTVYTGEFCNL